MTLAIVIKGGTILSVLYLQTVIEAFFKSQWFLRAILIYSIVVLLVNKIFKDSICVYMILFIALLPINFDAANINTYITNYPIFVFGYLYGKYFRIRFFDNGIVNIRKRMVLYSVYVVSLIVDFIFDFNSMPLVIYRLFYFTMGICGSVLFIDIMRMFYVKTNRYGGWRIVECLGQETLEFYVVAGYIDVELLQRVTKALYPSIFINLIETIIIMILSYVIIKTIKKSEFLNRFLFGGRNADKAMKQ